MSSDRTMSIVTYDKSELETINLSKYMPLQYNFNKIESNKTISNASFACSLNEKETNESLFNDEVQFTLSNDSLKYDTKTVINSCPALTKYISQIKTPNSKITINLPQWITKNALLEYFAYHKSNILMDSSVKNYYSILRLADCFENYTLIGSVIKTKIIPTLSYHSAILFLQESFQKIDHNNLNFNWYELFTATKEFISINIIQYIQLDYQKLISIQKNLLEEIIEYHLLLTNNMSIELLQFLISFRQCNDIYELISCEYLIACSEENYSDMLNSTYSFLQCNIKETGSFYQEIPKKYNNTLDVIFYISYKEAEDLFKVNFKVSNDHQVKLYSFTLIYFFDERHIDKKDSTVKVISSLKGCTNVIEINKFRYKRNKRLNIHMKLNPIHTHTLQYLVDNFQTYCNTPGLIKMSSTTLELVFQIHQAKKIADNTLVKAMSLWLNDEINMNDDLNNELIKMIDWKKVARADMYAFLVKYSWLIDKEVLSSYFLEELKIEKDLIIGIKQANFDKLLIENINLKRFIEAIKAKKESLEMHKELSEIKKTDDKMINESEEREVKIFLQSNAIDQKDSLMSLSSKANDYKPTSNTSMKKDTINSNKMVLKSYEPMRAIEFEISKGTLKENEIMLSLSSQMRLSPAKTNFTQEKQVSQKGRLPRNVFNKINLNSINNNNSNFKSKETSNASLKTTNRNKTDRCSSRSECKKSSKQGTKNLIDLIKNEGYSTFIKHKHRKTITTKNTKPQFYKGVYTLND